jgi:AcrR family transcriptional regulator
MEAAILKLKNRGEEITISAVARAVGVTPSLIHNTYPGVADQVRQIQGKSLREQRDELRAELKAVHEANQVLRAERDQALADASRLASLNEVLRFELANARAVASEKVAAIPARASTPPKAR